MHRAIHLNLGFDPTEILEVVFNIVVKPDNRNPADQRAI